MTRNPRSLAVLTALVLTILPTAGAGAAAPALAGADLVSIQDGDGQLNVRVRDGVQARNGAKGSDPGGITLSGPGTAAAIPAGPAFGFLGTPGKPVWAMATAGSEPFWDTTGLSAKAGPAKVMLAAVDGPGAFHSYTLSPVGDPAVQLGSSGPASFTLPVGTRLAAVWAFTAPGTYRITLQISTAKAKTNATYTVAVPENVFTNALPMRTTATRGLPGNANTDAAPDAAAVNAAATVGTGRKVFADGHIDMGPQVSGNGWIIRIRDDTVSPPVWRELADVVLHAVPASKIEVPQGSDYAFLGSPGSSVWMLPQVQQSGILWPGWNTQDPSVVSGTQGDTTWRLNSVTGPGKFKLFLTGSFGKPQVLFDSDRSLPQSMSIPPNTHAHGNWAFTAEGIYRLGVTMTAAKAGGGSLSDTKTLVVAVGNVDPSTGFGSGGGGNLARTGDDNWVIPAVGSGIGLVIVGTVLVLLFRRRRTANPAMAPGPSDGTGGPA